MKNLLKISCVLAIALFVSMSVKAQLSPQTITNGSLTVDVPEFMSFSVAPIDHFILKNTNDVSTTVSQDLTNQSLVDIKSNVKWSFSLLAVHDNLAATNSGDLIPITAFKYSGFDASNRVLEGNDIVVRNGEKNESDNLTWTLDPTDLGSIFAGAYSVALTYTLTQTAW